MRKTTYRIVLLTVLALAVAWPLVTSGQNAPLQPDSAIDSIGSTVSDTRPDIPWSITFGKIFWAVVVFFAGFYVLKYSTLVLESLAERWLGIRLLIKRLIPVLRVIGWTFVIYIIIAGIFAPPIQTLIAVTASAGIAIGFASQDILKNIFGGIMIIMDRPFQVGDKIQVGSFYGEVMQIGLRSVRLETPDDSLVSIPNAEIVNQSVSNSNSGQPDCQVVAEFYLPANVPIEELRKTAYRASAVSRYAYLNKPIRVIVKNEIHQGRSMLKVRLKAYVLDIRYEFLFASEMTEIVLSELFRKGVISQEDMAGAGV